MPETRIGRAVRMRRQELGLDQAAVAGLARISREQLSRIERGHHFPTRGTVALLASALACPGLHRVREEG